MTEGSWFCSLFAGGWRFAAGPDEGSAHVAWRYSFRCRPQALAPLAERIGGRLLQRDIERRIAGYAAGCLDPVVLAAARTSLPEAAG